MMDIKKYSIPSGYTRNSGSLPDLPLNTEMAYLTVDDYGRNNSPRYGDVYSQDTMSNLDFRLLGCYTDIVAYKVFNTASQEIESNYPEVKPITGILLQSGRFYDYLSPETNQFTIYDIARGLSNICRYNGQVPFHYSVAQHSVLCSYHVKEEDQQLAGLMHDAAEAFLGDVPTPLKALLPEYKLLEEKHEAEIFKRLGLQYPMHPSVKEADMTVLKAEVSDMGKSKQGYWGFLDSFDIRGVYPIEPMSQEEAMEWFIGRYYELTGKGKSDLI